MVLLHSDLNVVVKARKENSRFGTPCLLHNCLLTSLFFSGFLSFRFDSAHTALVDLTNSHILQFLSVQQLHSFPSSVTFFPPGFCDIAVCDAPILNCLGIALHNLYALLFHFIHILWQLG